MMKDIMPTRLVLKDEDLTRIIIRDTYSPAGYWRLGAGITTLFPVGKRPTDEQIANTKELLGWEWVEGK